VTGTQPPPPPPPGKGVERLPYSPIPWPSSLENIRSFLILFLFPPYALMILVPILSFFGIS